MGGNVRSLLSRGVLAWEGLPLCTQRGGIGDSWPCGLWQSEDPVVFILGLWQVYFWIKLQQCTRRKRDWNEEAAARIGSPNEETPGRRVGDCREGLSNSLVVAVVKSM